MSSYWVFVMNECWFLFNNFSVYWDEQIIFSFILSCSELQGFIWNIKSTFQSWNNLLDYVVLYISPIARLDLLILSLQHKSDFDSNCFLSVLVSRLFWPHNTGYVQYFFIIQKNIYQINFIC